MQSIENNFTDKLLFLANATEVERYHTDYTIQRQNIGDHSFGVAWGCWLLTSGKPSASLLMAALSHDVAEHKVGDVPSPTKRRLAGLREGLHKLEVEVTREYLGAIHDGLSAEDELVLRLADVLDGIMFCFRERRLGNRRIKAAGENFCTYARQMFKFSSTEQVEVMMAAIQLYEGEDQ